MTRSRNTTVHSASVGGAASAPIDTSVRVAPLRGAEHVVAAERRAAWATQDPWDPWPAQRVGYDAPAPASLFLPRKALDGLATYLARISVR
jgi:hypothetical protein